MIRPFLVLGLPRSRTFWLSRFLTYREWYCGHEQLSYVRTMEDAKSWFKQPFTGSCETAAASFWRLIRKIAPETRIVVIRRPIDEVMQSCARLEANINESILFAELKKANTKLDQITTRWPHVLSVRFNDLTNEHYCASIFEYCLPYDHDKDWWSLLSKHNLQNHVPAILRYAKAYEPQIKRSAAIAKQKMLSDLNFAHRKGMGNIVIEPESIETFYKEGQKLFAEHTADVGECPDEYINKNWDMLNKLDKQGNLQTLVARSNGRMFGYLMTQISPSLANPSVLMAVHIPMFASKSIPGLGMRLQREAISHLRERGVTEIWGRCGPRGDGPRMAVAYKRLGFEPDGELWRLNMES